MRGAYTMDELGVVLLLCMLNMLPVVTVRLVASNGRNAIHEITRVQRCHHVSNRHTWWPTAGIHDQRQRHTTRVSFLHIWFDR